MLLCLCVVHAMSTGAAIWPGRVRFPLGLQAAAHCCSCCDGPCGATLRRLSGCTVWPISSCINVVHAAKHEFQPGGLEVTPPAARLDSGFGLQPLQAGWLFFYAHAVLTCMAHVSKTQSPATRLCSWCLGLLERLHSKALMLRLR